MSEEENNMSLGLDMDKEYGGGFEPLPCIDVLTTISSAEIKNTKAGDGKYVKCSFKVISDDYNGRIIFVNYNIKNNKCCGKKCLLQCLRLFSEIIIAAN